MDIVERQAGRRRPGDHVAVEAPLILQTRPGRGHGKHHGGSRRHGLADGLLRDAHPEGGVGAKPQGVGGILHRLAKCGAAGRDQTGEGQPDNKKTGFGHHRYPRVKGCGVRIGSSALQSDGKWPARVGADCDLIA